MKVSWDNNGEVRTQGALVQSADRALTWEKFLSILSYRSRWECFGKWNPKYVVERSEGRLKIGT